MKKKKKIYFRPTTVRNRLETCWQRESPTLIVVVLVFTKPLTLSSPTIIDARPPRKTDSGMSQSNEQRGQGLGMSDLQCGTENYARLKLSQVNPTYGISNQKLPHAIPLPSGCRLMVKAE